MALTKTVMRLDMNGCYKCKKVALHSVTKMEGIDSLEINMKDSTMTVIGEADSVSVVNLLRRKFRCAELVSTGSWPPPPPPPKKEEKKEEPKKEEKPKEEPKKEEKPKEEPKKEEKPKEEPKKEEKPKEEKKEEKKEPEKPKEEEKKEEKKEPEKPKEAQAAQAVVHPHPHPYAVWHKVCDAQCYPPCPACSSRPEIMWPRYQQPGSSPNEVWYVWNEEKQESCTIM